MPLATISNQTVTAALTQANVIAALKTRMAAAGWSLASESPGTSHVVWFSRVFNGATYGTAFLRLTLSSAATSLAIATSYSLTGNLGTTSVSITPSTDLTISSVNHPEATGIILQQGTTVNPILVMRPANKPVWWGENSFIYAFLNSGAISMFGQPATHGLTGIGPLILTSSTNNQANPLNSSQFEIATLAGIISAQTFLGEFSSDVCYASRPSSIKATDTLIVSAGTEEYFVLDNFHAVRTI